MMQFGRAVLPTDLKRQPTKLLLLAISRRRRRQQPNVAAAPPPLAVAMLLGRSHVENELLPTPES